jgi:hypothetical protein
MKFKTVYILFNVVIVASFAVIFLMPLIMLGPDYFALFASKNWLAGLLFLATLIIINGYFLYNWKLFQLLEREDWHGVIRLLERRILGQPGRVRAGLPGGGRLRMLINAYLVTSQLDRLADLEVRLRQDGPAQLARFALPLGIPYLLRGDPLEAEKYFGRFLQQQGVAHLPWLRWNYAFALLQQRQVPAARTSLLDILAARADPVLRLLTVYILSSLTTDEPRTAAVVERERAALRGRYSPQRWRRIAGGKHIQMILLTPIIKDALDWLLGESPSPAAGPSSASPAAPGAPGTVH